MCYVKYFSHSSTLFPYLPPLIHFCLSIFSLLFHSLLIFTLLLPLHHVFCYNIFFCFHHVNPFCPYILKFCSFSFPHLILSFQACSLLAISYHIPCIPSCFTSLFLPTQEGARDPSPSRGNV